MFGWILDIAFWPRASLGINTFPRCWVGVGEFADKFLKCTFGLLFSGILFSFNITVSIVYQDIMQIMSCLSAVTTSINNPQLRLLNALRANTKPIMTFLGLPSFRSAQIVAQTGVDVSISPPV